MNWLTGAVGIIFLISIIVGIYRGAIKIVVSLAATLLTLVIVVFATPYVADLVEKKTPIDDMIKDQVIVTMTNAASSQGEKAVSEGMSEDSIRKVLKAAGISEEMLAEHNITVEDIASGKISSSDLSKYGISKSLLDGLGEDAQKKMEEAVENADIPRDVQIKAIEMAELPDIFKDLLTANNNDESYKELGANTFAQYVGCFLSKLIINILSFLGTFILVTVILRAVIFALDIISELPVLGFVNRLAGGVLGIVGALVIVWVLFIIITLLYTTSFGKDIYQTIQNEELLKMIYDWNPIMKLATTFR